MTFTLGYAPEKFKVVVAGGSDFFSSLRRSDSTNWPSTAVLTLDFGTLSDDPIPVAVAWEAELAGPVATWDIDQDDVDAMIATKPKKIRLWYVDGETRLLWASGVLVVS